MKKQSNTLLTKLSRNVLANLTMEVKETFATGFSLPIRKTFTSAELWNIQRRKKSVSLRGFSF